MMYKMDQGRLKEYHTSINSTDAITVHDENLQHGSLVVVDKDTVLLFRARVLMKAFTIVANDTIETLETVRYLRTLGFFHAN